MGSMRNCAGFFFHLTPLSHVCYNYHTMSDPRKIIGHKVTVEGEYIAKEATRGPNGGAAERKRVSYRESFDLPPAAHHGHAHGAMAGVLNKLLPERLAAKDPKFRGVLTHHVVHHENVEAK